MEAVEGHPGDREPRRPGVNGNNSPLRPPCPESSLSGITASRRIESCRVIRKGTKRHLIGHKRVQKLMGEAVEQESHGRGLQYMKSRVQSFEYRENLMS